MKNKYKLSAMLFIALLLISAQGVEAQRATPKTNSSNSHYNKQNQRDARFDQNQDRRRGYERNNGNAYGKGHGKGDDLRIDPRGHGHGHDYGFNQRVGHHFHKGSFYTYRYDQWRQSQAPVGFRVDFLPIGCQVVYTRFGVFYQFGNTYFQQARRGRGFVVVYPPRYRRAW